RLTLYPIELRAPMVNCNGRVERNPIQSGGTCARSVTLILQRADPLSRDSSGGTWTGGCCIIKSLAMSPAEGLESWSGASQISVGSGRAAWSLGDDSASCQGSSSLD